VPPTPVVGAFAVHMPDKAPGASRPAKAETDDLTGLANRRALGRMLAAVGVACHPADAAADRAMDARRT
jgi:hypothetical protein